MFMNICVYIFTYMGIARVQRKRRLEFEIDQGEIYEKVWRKEGENNIISKIKKEKKTKMGESGML